MPQNDEHRRGWNDAVAECARVCEEEYQDSKPHSEYRIAADACAIAIESLTYSQFLKENAAGTEIDPAVRSDHPARDTVSAAPSAGALLPCLGNMLSEEEIDDVRIKLRAAPGVVWGKWESPSDAIDILCAQAKLATRAPDGLARRLRELSEKATPQPWRSDCILPPEHSTRLHTIRSADDPPTQIVADALYDRDGIFIVALVNALPEILAALDGLERKGRE